MKLVFALLAVASFLLCGAAFAKQPRSVTVAVIAFEDRSGQGLVDIDGAAHTAVESFLTGLPGVRVVTRDKLRAVLREQSFNVSGFVGNRARAGQIGNLLGADYAVTDSVVRYGAAQQRLYAYGTNGVSVSYVMAANLQVVDLKTGELLLSKNVEAERRELYPDAYAAPRGPSGMEQVLMDTVVRKAAPDLARIFGSTAGHGATAPTTVHLPIRTTPDGADIEVDGVYLGAAPTTIEINQGTHVIRLELQGYHRWEKKVKVDPGLEVNVRLAPIDSQLQGGVP